MLRSFCLKYKILIQTQCLVSTGIKFHKVIQSQRRVSKTMSSWVEDELAKHSTERLYIEYSGFLTNHLSHSIIALGRLDADLPYVHDHVRHYMERLEGRDGPTARNQQTQTHQDISDLLGQRKGFYEIKKWYEDVLQNKHNNCIETFVQQEFHKLYLGLSYMHHSYTPLVFSSPQSATTLGGGRSSLLQVLHKIRQDNNLKEFMKKESEEDWVRRRRLGTFQNRMLALVTKRGDELVKYAHMVKAPPDALSSEKSLAAWVLESSIVLYQTSTKTNDFFLLHGVTATWALCNILQVLTDKSQMLEVLRVHVSLLFAVYLARDAPELDMNLMEGEDSRNITNQDIRNMVLKLPPQTDEHVYKLVQVCLETSRGKHDDKFLGRLCRAAALTAIKYPLKI